jgi:transposase-like protein
VRAQLRPTNDSWRVDETSIKGQGEWADLDRAVDSAGHTLDFVLSPFRHAQAAEYFFRPLLGDGHTGAPRVINVDRNAAYPPAFKALPEAGQFTPECALRPVKYLNNIIEQDQRFIKRRVRPGLGFSWYRTAWATVQGYEAMHQLPKGQVRGTSRGDLGSQNRFSARACGGAA